MPSLIRVTAGWVAFVACVAVVIVPSLLYDFPEPFKPSYSLARVQDGRLIYAPEGYGFWNTESGQRVWIPRFGIVGTGNVTAVTGNPKIRSIDYNLYVYVDDPEKYFLSGQVEHKQDYSSTNRPGGIHFQMLDYNVPGEGKSFKEDIGRRVSGLMYEFNDQHSRELAEFSNPLDRSQNDAFRVLIEPWMNERLANDGLKVAFLSFSISYPK